MKLKSICLSLCIAGIAQANTAKKYEDIDAYIKRFNEVFELADANVGKPEVVLTSKHFSHLTKEDKQWLSTLLVRESRSYNLRLARVDEKVFLSNKKFGVKLANFEVSEYQDKKTISYNGKTFSSYSVNRDLPLRERTKELDAKVQIALRDSKTNISKLERAFELMVKTFSLPLQLLTACGQSQGTWFPSGASTAILDSGGMGRTLSPMLPTGMQTH